MLLRRAARRLRPQTRGLSAMPTSFADYAEADETMQDYAGNVRRLGRLLGERVALDRVGVVAVGREDALGRTDRTAGGQRAEPRQPTVERQLRRGPAPQSEVEGLHGEPGLVEALPTEVHRHGREC